MSTQSKLHAKLKFWGVHGGLSQKVGASSIEYWRRSRASIYSPIVKVPTFQDLILS